MNEEPAFFADLKEDLFTFSYNANVSIAQSVVGPEREMNSAIN